MIILIDLLGILIVTMLGFQGYKDYRNICASYIIPCLCSFSIFYKIFPLIYSFTLMYIPNTIVAGVITIIAINSVLIAIFHRMFIAIHTHIQEKFFLPEPPVFTKKVIAVTLGLLTGYIFTSGAISALEEYNHTGVFRQSQIYKLSHTRKQQKATHNKIDNLPSLRELYSEENVIRFNFTESELIAILKMIRAISNADAHSLLQNLDSNENIKDVYQNLIEVYTKIDTESIDKRYTVTNDNIDLVKHKIGFQRQVSKKAPSKIYTSKANIKSISDIIDLI